MVAPHLVLDANILVRAESVEVADQETVDQAWSDELSARVNDILSGKVQTIPGEQVFADLAERRAARQAARNA